MAAPARFCNWTPMSIIVKQSSGLRLKARSTITTSRPLRFRKGTCYVRRPYRAYLSRDTHCSKLIASQLQTELARHVVLKYTPILIFHLDDSIERGARVIEILSGNRDTASKKE